jgi:hypothetical protein
MGHAAFIGRGEKEQNFVRKKGKKDTARNMQVRHDNNEREWKDKD